MHLQSWLKLELRVHEKVSVDTSFGNNSLVAMKEGGGCCMEFCILLAQLCSSSLFII